MIQLRNAEHAENPTAAPTDGSGAGPRSKPPRPPPADASIEPQRSSDQSSAPPFLVAAIGASAGGLEAFSSLLRAIPAEAPLALILVQHLARDQRSILPELLGHVTKLDVLTARDHHKLEPGYVYVIPPDARMTVSDGHLRVRPTGPQRDTEGTVDVLFRSIADEYKERAIGVVLSGSASDGAAGVRAIKAVGGITMAQQPEEASVDSMPRTAIATGMIDAVLPVQEIADQLVRLARHPFFTHLEEFEPEAPDSVAQMLRVFQLLRRSAGIDFSSYKLPTLKRRIERRMALHRLSQLSDYVELLQRDPSELQALEGELLIHVTSFFREPASYAALAELVFPRLLPRKPENTPIRFWVPGCSTGEEVYSLAMMILEFLDERGKEVPLQIFGTDVSEATIDKARAGLYPSSITADVSPERIRRFFTRSDGHYRVNRAVRDRCVFARQDVTRDPPFSKLDLIVCRNLLIYLNAPTQRKVLGVFHYSLRPQGILMLGGSESVGNQSDLFSLFAKKFQLYTKKSESGESHEVAIPGLPPRRTTIPPAMPVLTAKAETTSVRPLAWDGQNDANRFLLDRYAPPAVVVGADLRILRSRGSTSRFLELPSGDVSVDILKMVRPELSYAIRTGLAEARSKGRPVSKNDLRFKVDGRQRGVDVQIVPMGSSGERQVLIVFEERTRPGVKGAAVVTEKGRKKTDHAPVAAVERELTDTRNQLQAIIDDLGVANEELQSANEEVLSSNEELQSTNEELDTAKEELQSTNEELITLNDELRGRNDELSAANSDLSNVLASVQIPIVMVTRELRIRRVTPAAEKVLNVIPSDVGRPIGHLKPNFVCPDLEALITEAIDTISIREREVVGTDGRVFALQIRPYKTVDNRIDGAVLVVFDVSAMQDSASALEVATATGEALIASIREPILLLDSSFKVQRANQPFLDTFQVMATETDGRLLYDLADGQWNIASLRRLLEEILPEQKNFKDFEVEADFPRVGRKKLRVDGRRIESGRRKQGVILLMLEDVTNHAA